VKDLITSSCDTVSPLIQDGVELKQDVSDDIGEAHTDKARLQQMVINLLSNAIKFTESGTVSVEASTVERESPSTPLGVNSGRGNGGKTLVIAVSDTGKGIPAKELPTLFDEYRQVEGQSESIVQKGTGLGLSITKKFAELLGGSVSVVSEVGKGTTFEVSIPIDYKS
jgi:two-component system chemotaxis sensor kinase CheA